MPCDSNLDIFIAINDVSKPGMSYHTNNIGNDPMEFFDLKGGSINQIAIGLIEGPEPPYMKILNYLAYNHFESADPPFNDSIISAHANTAHTAAIGAAYEAQYFATLEQEPYSSSGGQPVFFYKNGERRNEPIIHNKPNVVGPDVSAFNCFFHDFNLCVSLL